MNDQHDDKVDFSAIDQITHGDARQARRLRATLAVIARRTDDPQLRQLVVSVLGGSVSVRRVFEHPSFWKMAQANFDNLQRGLDRLSPEQREDVMGRVGREHTPDEEIDSMRETVGSRPTPAPKDPPEKR